MVKRKKATIKDWGIVLLALLDDLAVFALILVAFWYFKVEVPIWLVIVMALVLGSLAFLTHRAIIPILHRRKAVGREAMLGIICEVVEPLAPQGVVWMNGEYWKAKSVSVDCHVGETVRVVRLIGLTLEVVGEQSDDEVE